jgi:hypothetical protein
MEKLRGSSLLLQETIGIDDNDDDDDDDDVWKTTK